MNSLATQWQSIFLIIFYESRVSKITFVGYCQTSVHKDLLRSPQHKRES